MEPETSIDHTILMIAKTYAIGCHHNTNHLYDGQPYRVHLDMVYDTAIKFIHLIPENDQPNVLSACYTHDLAEDARETFNDIKKATNEVIAELTYALTNEKGRSRAERANDKYYEGIRNTPYATFIKLCDRIANVTYSKEKGSDMLRKYCTENPGFAKQLYEPQYEPMFDYLAKLF